MRGVELCLFVYFFPLSLVMTIVPTLRINGSMEGVGELSMVELRHIILMNFF